MDKKSALITVQYGAYDIQQNSSKARDRASTTTGAVRKYQQGEEGKIEKSKKLDGKSH